MNKNSAHLSTHVLDTAHGRPAGGMRVQLWEVSSEGARLVTEAVTNRDGRTDKPLAGELASGEYEIVFFVGEYFAGIGGGRGFLGKVPVRFFFDAERGNHHVPLLCSPWSYTTYRGS